MFNVTTLSDYLALNHQFIEQKGLCLIFVFVGFGILSAFLGGLAFSKDDWSFRYFCIFCVIIGLLIELFSFGFLLKVERNIGILNNEWNQYQIMLEEQERVKNE